MKDQLVFDTTSAATILDSDSVGAFVRSDDGTLITHHTVSGDEGLDVYVLNSSLEVTQGTSPWVIGDGGSSITVDAVDFDIRDLTAVSDSIQAWAHDGAGTAITSTLVGADQALDVNVVSGINVEVDLSHLDDSIRLGDGTSFFTSTSENSDIALDVHISNSNIEVTQGTSPWVVSATDFDIRDLSHLAGKDSVQLGNGTNFITDTTIGSDIGLDVNVINDPALANTAILSSADTLAVPGTAEKVVAANLANRKYLFVYNFDNRKMYVGGSGVDKDNGFPISPGAYIELRAGAAVDVYYDSEKAAHAIRNLELS